MTSPITIDIPARRLAALIGDDQARTVIKAGWDALRPLVEAGQLQSGIADYAATVAALAALQTLGIRADEKHLIEFRADGWTLQHPLSCRPNLFACPANRAAEFLNGPPSELGVYDCWLDPQGRFEIGELQETHK